MLNQKVEEYLKTVQFEKQSVNGWYETWTFGNWTLFRYSDGTCIWEFNGSVN